MAAIYNKNAEQLTDGLRGSDVCDEAIQAAQRMARDRNEPVYLDDDDGHWTVNQDGSADEGWDWE